ncbi:MAG: RNA-binding protein [Firmicutes bacterium]|nr:RNA-binding protein [Bacillota bacterium]
MRLAALQSLYVGNLPWAATEADLLALFAAWHPARARAATDRETGRSRGFGFVDVPAAEAEAAVAALDRTLFRGRTLVVNLARPREPCR